MVECCGRSVSQASRDGGTKTSMAVCASAELYQLAAALWVAGRNCARAVRQLGGDGHAVCGSD